MPKQRGQLLLSRKLIYHYPERLVSFLFKQWRVSRCSGGWCGRSGSPGVPAHPRECSAVESRAACVWEHFPVDLEINKRIVGKSCSAFIMSGIRSKGMWLEQIKYSSRLHEQQVPT